MNCFMKSSLLVGLLSSCLPAVVSCSQTPDGASGDGARKIPLEAAHWYQLNNRGDQVTPGTGLAQLSDGVTDKAVFMGWGKLLTTYDCYYEFKNLRDVRLTKIRLYDGEGAFANQPFKLYAKASATARPQLLTTFTGEAYQQWQEIRLPAPVQAQYLVLNTSWGFPTELELYGTYQTAPPATLPPPKPVRLGNELGVNAFVWDFMQSDADANVRDQVYEPKLRRLQAFTQYRDYVDWEKLEATQGRYTFNPTVSGGWNYDVLYKRLRQEGKLVLPCLKTLPGWFSAANYPADQRDAENVPAAAAADRLDPASYVLQAKLAFQFAARYGANARISPALLAGVVTGPVYATAPAAGARTREVGLNYIQYIECENERDKWWKGRKAYQTAREYAANLSAFYDGHKGTLGPGVGVKAADSTMQVVMGGIASTQTDYARGIIDWCKEFRGYRSDGRVDLCFDVLNYHAYANASGESQSGQSARGGSAGDDGGWRRGRCLRAAGPRVRPRSLDYGGGLRREPRQPAARPGHRRQERRAGAGRLAAAHGPALRPPRHQPGVFLPELRRKPRQRRAVCFLGPAHRRRPQARRRLLLPGAAAHGPVHLPGNHQHLPARGPLRAGQPHHLRAHHAHRAGPHGALRPARGRRGRQGLHPPPRPRHDGGANDAGQHAEPDRDGDADFRGGGGEVG